MSCHACSMQATLLSLSTRTMRSPPQAWLLASITLSTFRLRGYDPPVHQKPDKSPEEVRQDVDCDHAADRHRKLQIQSRSEEVCRKPRLQSTATEALTSFRHLGAGNIRRHTKHREARLGATKLAASAPGPSVGLQTWPADLTHWSQVERTHPRACLCDIHGGAGMR